MSSGRVTLLRRSEQGMPLVEFRLPCRTVFNRRGLKFNLTAFGNRVCLQDMAAALAQPGCPALGCSVNGISALSLLIGEDLNKIRSFASLLSLNVASCAHAFCMLEEKTTPVVKSYKTALAKHEYRAQGKMLITPPGHPQ